MCSSVSAKAMDGGGSKDGWWSDEEWRKWRLQQRDSASGKQGADPDKKHSLKQERIKEKDNFVQKQLADAASLLSASSSSVRPVVG